MGCDLESTPVRAARADYVTSGRQVILSLQAASGGSFGICWFVIMMTATPSLGKLEYAAA